MSSFGGMDSINQQIRYLVDVEGVEGLERLNQVQVQTKANIASYFEELRQGRIAPEDFVTSVMAQVDVLNLLDRALKKLGGGGVGSIPGFIADLRGQTEAQAAATTAMAEYAAGVAGASNALNEQRAQNQAAARGLAEYAGSLTLVERGYHQLTAALAAYATGTAAGSNATERAAQAERVAGQALAEYSGVLSKAEVAQRSLTAAFNEYATTAPRGSAAANDQIAQNRAAARGLAEYTGQVMAFDAAESRAQRQLVAGVPKVQQARQSYYNIGTTLYFVSQAAQDAEYGFAAVNNNIGLITLSFAGMLGAPQNWAMGIAATTQVLGVAIDMLHRRVGEFVAELGPEKFKSFATGLDSIKADLKQISDKPLKLDVDFRRIDEAQKKVDRLQAELAAFEATKLSTDQEKLAAAAVETIGTVGGTKLSEGLTEIRRQHPGELPVSPELFKQKETLDRAQVELDDVLKQLKDAKGVNLGPSGPSIIAHLGERRDQLKTDVATLKKGYQDQLDQQITSFIGRFKLGDEATIGKFAGLAGKYGGILGPEFSEAVGAMPKTAAEVRAHAANEAAYKLKEEDDRVRKAEETAADQEEKRLAAEHKAEQDRLAAQVAQGAGRKESLDALKLLKAGKTPREAAEAIAPDLVATAEALVKIPDEAVGVALQAAQDVVRSLNDDFSKAVSQGKPSREQAWADVEAQVEAKPDVSPVQRAKEKAEREAAKVEREKDAAIKAEAGKYRAGLAKDAEMVVADRLGRGEAPEKIQAEVGPQLQVRLEDRGTNKGISAEVAKRIIQDQLDAVMGQMNEGEDAGDIADQLRAARANQGAAGARAIARPRRVAMEHEAASYIPDIGPANQEQAAAVAKKAVDLHEHRGIPLAQATIIAYQEVAQQVVNMAMKYQQMEQQLAGQRNAFTNLMQKTTTRRGNFRN